MNGNARGPEWYNTRKHKKHIVKIIDDNGGDARHCYTDGRVKWVRYKFSTLIAQTETGFPQSRRDLILKKVQEFIDSRGIQNAVLEWETKLGLISGRVTQENVILKIMR